MRGVAQLASALRSGRRGRKFESSHPDHIKWPCKLNIYEAIFVSSTKSSTKLLMLLSRVVFKIPEGLIISYKQYILELYCDPKQHLTRSLDLHFQLNYE